MSAEITRQPDSKRKITVQRKLLFGGFTLLICLLVLEFGSRFAMPAFMGSNYQSNILFIEQKDLSVDGRGSDNAREVLHPYFGWTYDPQTDPGTTARGQLHKINDHGFFDAYPLTKKGPNTTIVAILGGSFANEFTMVSDQALIAALKRSPKFQNQEVELINLALAGFKQPQQLMILNYMLAHGAEYDYVINFDGFNEGVLPATDNVEYGLSIGHPHRWQARLEDVVNPKLTSVSYRLHEVRAKRQILAKRVMDSPIKWSYLRQIFWKVRDRSLQAQMMDLSREILDQKNEGNQFAVSGPLKAYDNSDVVHQDMIDLWFNCSWQMQLLCDGYGTTYLHCLQPNQYLPEAKTVFSDWELENALAEDDHPFRLAVMKSYPMMRERGGELAERAVNFVDLTQIFKNETQTVYKDWCCHANEAGYDLVAKVIADAIVKAKEK